MDNVWKYRSETKVAPKKLCVVGSDINYPRFFIVNCQNNTQQKQTRSYLDLFADSCRWGVEFDKLISYSRPLKTQNHIWT